jgi:hypothetical protein
LKLLIELLGFQTRKKDRTQENRVGMKDGVKMNLILLAALHPASYSLSKDDNSRLPIKTNAFSSPIASSLHLSLVVGCE